jgi:hypothetical protein
MYNIKCLEEEHIVLNVIITPFKRNIGIIIVNLKATGFEELNFV